MAKPFRERNPIVVGAISIAILTVLMVFAFFLNEFTFITGRYITEADFADAAGLTEENEVRVAGLKVGSVRSIELVGPGERRDRVRVTMEIDRGVRLGSASTAEIKLKTLLGQKFVSITPRGGDPLLSEGGRIPLERTRIPFELYQVQNRSVDKLGALDAEALNEALRELAAVTEDPEGNFGRALDGLARATRALSERDEELESLLENADPVVDALASRSDALARILEDGAEILGVLQARREALKGFVRGTDRMAEQVGGLLQDTRADLDPALRDLHTVLEVLEANVPELEDTVQVLGTGSESFGRVFLQGNWGNVYLQSAAAPLPTFPEVPLLEGGVEAVYSAAVPGEVPG